MRLLRLQVRRLWRAIKRELPLEFGHEQPPECAATRSKFPSSGGPE